MVRATSRPILIVEGDTETWSCGEAALADDASTGAGRSAASPPARPEAHRRPRHARTRTTRPRMCGIMRFYLLPFPRANGRESTYPQEEAPWVCGANKE